MIFYREALYQKTSTQKYITYIKKKSNIEMFINYLPKIDEKYLKTLFC